MHERLSGGRRARDRLSKSLPTPNTHELLRVVVSVAVGAPERALARGGRADRAGPFVPDVSTPVKLTTVATTRRSVTSSR